jgi:hypothetical protein
MSDADEERDNTLIWIIAVGGALAVLVGLASAQYYGWLR